MWYLFLQVKMAESKPGLRKPVFTKVEQLRPGTGGHTLTVKVVSAKMVLQKGRADGPQVRQMKIAECLVGDETGLIIFTARNDQGFFFFFFFESANSYSSSVWLIGS
jgi:replication factor A1